MTAPRTTPIKETIETAVFRFGQIERLVSIVAKHVTDDPEVADALCGIAALCEASANALDQLTVAPSLSREGVS